VVMVVVLALMDQEEVEEVLRLRKSKGLKDWRGRSII